MSNALSPVGQTPLSRLDGAPVLLMCPPDYFTVSYVINPWMEKGASNIRPGDANVAKRQWDRLYRILTQKAGADVRLLDPVSGLPDLLFTANAAFVYRQRAVVARYRHPERRGEESWGMEWFERHGFDVIVPPDGVFFEGAGDAFLLENRIFAGYDIRTSLNAHRLLSDAVGLPVISMELLDPRFYHLDTCFCPLTDGSLLYAPVAFSDAGNRRIEAAVPAEKRIPVTIDEAAQFACNAVNLGDVMVLHEGSPRLTELLTQRGFHVISTDLGEFLKSGGSAKCLTLQVG